MPVSRAIQKLMDEADSISRRSKPTAQDKLRHSYLLTKIASLRAESGHASSFSASEDYRATEFRARLVNAWRLIAKGELPISEIRANQESGLATITNANNAAGGAFVPVQFLFSDLQVALAAHDPLFDADKVTLITTKNGNTVEMPMLSDVSQKAVPVTEAASDTTYTNLASVGNAENNTFMYRTPKIKTSMEFGEDVFADFQVSILERAFTERIARGVGADMIAGNSAGHIKGIIPSLESLGVVPVTAAGSGSDDGGSGTGANSIGSQDIRNLYFSVNSAYRNSPKAAWLMNDTVLLAIAGLRDKQNHLLNLVQYDGNGQPRIFGKPVYVSPSCPNIATSASGPVLFGDLSRWVTRQVPGDNYVRRYTQAPGLAENALVAWSCFARYGGQLLAIDPAYSPINYLQMHS